MSLKKQKATIKNRGVGRRMVLSAKEKKTLEGLAAIGCGYEEMASVMGISASVLEHSKLVREIKAKGVGTGKITLRRKQYEVAMTGDRAMLIWLGKQRLDQSEKTENKNENIEIRVTRVSKKKANEK